MNRKAKVWLITAAALILVGCMIIGGVMTVLKWDFSKLSTVQYETNTYVIDESFKHITIAADTADIVFVPSEAIKVICYEEKNMTHTVAVKEDALSIELIDTRKWYEYIGISLGVPKLTVYLPQGGYGELSIVSDTGDVEIPKEFSFESMGITLSTGRVMNDASVLGDVKITTSTGDICVEGISAGSVDLEVSTGQVSITDVTCKGDVRIGVSTGRTSMTNVKCQSFLSRGNTGHIALADVIVEALLSIERSTGDVDLERCDAAELFVKTSTGNVKGSLLSEKVFIVRTDTGRVDVPKTVNGGRCEITTDTGDIKLAIAP